MMRWLFLFLLLPLAGLARPDTTLAHQSWLEGEKQYSLQEYGLAGPAYLRAEKAFLKAGFDLRAGDCLLNAALSFRNVRKPESITEAISVYQNSLAKSWGPVHTSNVCMARLEYWFAKRNLDSAEVQGRKAVEIRQKLLGDWNWKTNQSRTSLGIILDMKGDGPGALEAFLKVLESAEKNFPSPHERIQRAINNVGNAYASLQDFRKAKEYYHASLQMAQKLHGPLSMRTESSLNNLAHVSVQMRDYDSAIYYRQKVRPVLVQNLGAQHINTLMNESQIGDNYLSKSQYDEAIRIFDGLVEQLRKLPKEEYNDLSYQLGQLADCYYAKEEYDKAELYYRRSLTTAAQAYGPTYIVVGVYHYGIGQCRNQMGDYAEALVQFRKAFEIQLPELGLESGNIGMILQQIGKTHFHMNHLDSAIHYFERARVIFEKTTDLDYMDQKAEIYMDLGEVYDRQQNYSQAIALKKRGISVMNASYRGKHPYRSSPHYALAKTYVATHQWDLALRSVFKAMDENQTGIMDTLTGKPVFAFRNILDLPNHASHLLFAAEIVVQSQRPDFEKAWQLLLIADSVLIKLQKTRSKESDQVALGAQIREVSNLALFVLHQLQKKSAPGNVQKIKESIFYFASRRQASALVQTLAANKARKVSGIPPALLEQDRSLKIQIQALDKDLQELAMPQTRHDSVQKEVLTTRRFDLQRDADQLNRRLEAGFPRLKALLNASQFPTRVDLQAQLLSSPKKTALVSTIWDEEHPFIYVTSQGLEKLISLPPDSQLNRNIWAYRNAIRLGNQELAGELSYKIYSVNFSALDSLLQKEKVEKLVLVTEGPWSSFPFEALGFRTKTSTGFWVDRYEISYTQSIPLWIENQKSAKTSIRKEVHQLTCLAFAPVFEDEEGHFLGKGCEPFVRHYSRNTDKNSTTRAFDKDGQTIAPLPFTEAEVKQMSGVFGKDKNLFFKYFVRQDARESTFKSAMVTKADYIHLATHGLVSEDRPELSGLLFHPTPNDTTDDGILFTGEIYNLELSADLVTLSACETGLGKMQNGEGMLGLTRSFTYAGAKNLIVSLWKVNDKATADLMVEFYNQLLSGHSKAESLRRAKKKLRKNPATANPYFWAPFILVEG